MYITVWYCLVFGLSFSLSFYYTHCEERTLAHVSFCPHHLNSGSPTRVLVPPQESFLIVTVEGEGLQTSGGWRPGCLKHVAVLRTAPYNKEVLSQKVRSAEKLEPVELIPNKYLME